jgi:hypothetical protein
MHGFDKKKGQIRKCLLHSKELKFNYQNPAHVLPFSLLNQVPLSPKATLGPLLIKPYIEPTNNLQPTAQLH